MRVQGLSRHPRRRAMSGLTTAVLALTVAVMVPLLGTGSASAAVSDPASLVNTLIGTSNQGETFPGAVTPFGMVQWSPENTRGNQTRTVEPGGYGFDATRIRGFSLTHMSGTGCAGGYGDIPFYPRVGSVGSSPSSDTSDTIDAANRTITGSVTSGNFCGYINTIGRRSYYTLRFVAVFDKPFSVVGTWRDGTVTQGSTTSSGGTTYGTDGFPPPGRGSGAFVSFDTSAGRTVNVRVGISFVSTTNARANLTAENPAGRSFDTVRQRAHDAWNTALGRVGITGGTTNQQVTFYTALYHALLHPNVFSDVNGQYRGMDQAVHTVSAGHAAQYANFSGWDAYRSQLALVTLLQPDVGSDIAQSLFNQATQNGGVWDRWTHGPGGTHVMTGDPAHAAVPFIYAFGGTNFDAGPALDSMLNSARNVTAADLSRDGWNVMVIGERPSLDKWLSIHYIPTDGNAWGGAGETLEDSVADFGIAQLALRLGRTSVHQEFITRAQFWKHVWNPAAAGGVGYIQNRNANGSFPSFNPASDDGFAEGSAAQ